MSPFRWSITSCLVVVAVLASTASARAQVQVRVDNKPPPRAVHPQAIEAASYLELYGHPVTAHRRIEVHVAHDRVEMSGTVADETERLTAERLAAIVAPDRKIVNRIQVDADGQFLRIESGSGEGSPADLKRHFTDVLAAKFPPEIMRELALTVYRVGDVGDAGAVLVLEGTVPSTADQLAMSEALLFGSPAAAAVVNRTHVARGYVKGYRPGVSLRVPFVGLDVDVDRGVDLDLGPLAIRAGGRYRVGDDPILLDRYVTAVRADADLQIAALQPRVLGGVLTLEGRLKAAERMRAVALALDLRGIRGVVDRTEVVEGGPAYYRQADLTAYLRYRLGEHAGVRELELLPAPQEQLKLQALVPTGFHAALATAVIANDAALSELPIEPTFREGMPEATPRK